MVSIHIDLSDDLRARAEQEARLQGVSLEDFVRSCLSETLSKPSKDPLLADDVVFEGTTPPDLAAKHDDYLYGDAP